MGTNTTLNIRSLRHTLQLRQKPALKRITLQIIKPTAERGPKHVKVSS